MHVYLCFGECQPSKGQRIPLSIGKGLHKKRKERDQKFREQVSRCRFEVHNYILEKSILRNLFPPPLL